jgi:hypothetical protein
MKVIKLCRIALYLIDTKLKNIMKTRRSKIIFVLNLKDTYIIFFSCIININNNNK